jgi:hypothetical protein
MIFYIGHPYDLAFFKRLISALDLRSKYRITLIITKINYFRDFKVMGTLASRISDEIISFEEEQIPNYTYRNIVKNLENIRNFKSRIAHLSPRKSVFISNDKSVLSANILLNYFENNILFQQTSNFKAEDYRVDWLRSGLYVFYCKLARLNTIFVLKNKNASNEVFQLVVTKPNFNVMFLSRNKKLRSISLPYVASSKKSNKMVIFGSRYDTWQFLKENKQRFKEELLEIYRTISSLFLDYIIYYKPHPKETGTEFIEINKIFNGKLLDVGVSLNAELFLMENSDIKYCFSIGSTSSKSAHEMGFNSKVMYRALCLTSGEKRMFDNIFNEMPAHFFIQQFNQENLDKWVNDEYSNLKDFQEVLNKLTC